MTLSLPFHRAENLLFAGDALDACARLPDGVAFDLVYLDPPYYEKGDQLYKHKFTPQNHEDLAATLKAAEFDWAISYDDHHEIRRLYDGATVKRLEITYTNAVCTDPTRRKNHEVLISPAGVSVA